MVSFGIATIIAVSFYLLQNAGLVTNPHHWSQKFLWAIFFILGIGFFLDDSGFYYQSYKMERIAENNNENRTEGSPPDSSHR